VRAGPACASDAALGVPSWIEKAATASATSTPVAANAAAQRWWTTSRAHAAQARQARSSRRARGQSSLGPTDAKSTGSRVVATATLTSAISKPPIPMVRRTGTGRATRASSEIATVVPLKTTEEPARSIAASTAASLPTPFRRSSRHRITTRRA
jgi:hypothetical protein